MAWLEAVKSAFGLKVNMQEVEKFTDGRNDPACGDFNPL